MSWVVWECGIAGRSSFPRSVGRAVPAGGRGFQAGWASACGNVWAVGEHRVITPGGQQFLLPGGGRDRLLKHVRRQSSPWDPPSITFLPTAAPTSPPTLYPWGLVCSICPGVMACGMTRFPPQPPIHLDLRGAAIPEPEPPPDALECGRAEPAVGPQDVVGAAVGA
jgi:hypothetical protein